MGRLYKHDPIRLHLIEADFVQTSFKHQLSLLVVLTLPETNSSPPENWALAQQEKGPFPTFILGQCQFLGPKRGFGGQMRPQMNQFQEPVPDQFITNFKLYIPSISVYHVLES